MAIARYTTSSANLRYECKRVSVWTRNGEANALVIIYVELFIVMLHFRGALQARTEVRVCALVGE